MKIGFVQVAVSNLEESIVFYKEILQMEECRRFSPREGVSIVILCDENRNKIELIENKNINYEKRGNSLESNVAIGFLVEDLDMVIEDLIKKNIEIIRGPISVENGMKFIFIKDPNDVEIEIIQGFKE